MAINDLGILKNQNVKKVIANFFSLSFLQATNFIIPLIAIPYLIRVLGDEKFGLVMFAQVFIQYFMLLVDFGLDYTATREISIHKNNWSKINEIFNTVFSLKVILLLISVFIITIIILLFPQFRFEWELYVLTFGMVIGQILYPVWLFQGLEKMKYLMIFNLISKLSFTLLIFIFIQNTSDYLYYAIINSLGYIIAGITSFVFALFLIKFKLHIPTISKLKKAYNDTVNVFITNIGVSLYMTSTPFILGIVTGKNEYVGYYIIAEKTVRGLRYIITPLTQALYPHFSKLFSEKSLKNSIIILKKLIFYLSPVLLLLVILLFIFVNELTLFLSGSSNINIILNIKILSFILIFGTVNNIIGVLGMINLKMEKYFRNCVLIAGASNIATCIVLSYFFDDNGASVSVLLTEMLLSLLLIYKLYKCYYNV